MAVPAGLDLDLLRSFVAIAEEQSFTRAAARVGRRNRPSRFKCSGSKGCSARLLSSEARAAASS